jgi:hypothetical protein
MILLFMISIALQRIVTLSPAVNSEYCTQIFGVHEHQCITGAAIILCLKKCGGEKLKLVSKLAATCSTKLVYRKLMGINCMSMIRQHCFASIVKGSLILITQI